VPVVDASVVVDWVAPGVDPGLPALSALATLAAQEAELTAPRVLMEEVANALLAGVRRQRWRGAEADASHALLRELPVRLLDEPRAWDLARRYDDHPIYDMVYVALAERTRSVLITADRALRRRLVGLDWLIGPEDVQRSTK
jgi:predicted nucleic acid-binding protein